MAEEFNKCRYGAVCPYSILNCNQEFMFCKQYSKYVNDEKDAEVERREANRAHHMGDIGLVAVVTGQRR